MGSSMKNKYLFYYEEAVSAWIPAPNDLSCIISIEDEEVNEKFEIEFKVVELTKNEFNDLKEV